MKRMQKHKSAKHTRLVALLGGLLWLFPLLLPATALAAPRSATASPPLTKAQQIVDLAGVSVVRLALGYVPSNGRGTTFCTLLGTIVASWSPLVPSEQNTWVLTDGSLLSTSKKNTCLPNGTLSSISLFVSNEFTGNQPTLAALENLNCSPGCSDSAGPQTIVALSGNSATLFSFHTSTALPFVAVEQASTDNNPAPTSIELSASTTTNSLPPSATKNVNLDTLTRFLTPIAPSSTPASAPGSAPATTGTPSANAQTTEPGMPFVDENGKFTGMQLANTAVLATTTEIENLEKLIPVPPGTTLPQKLANNTLSQQWDSGIIQYEQGNYQAANQTLNSIQNAPATFKAPATFSALAREKFPSRGETSGSSTASSQGNQVGLSSWLTVIGLIVGILALVLLFVLISVRFGRKRAERKRELASYKADEEKARQRVERREKLIPVPQQFSPSSYYGGAVDYPPATNIPPAPGQPIIARPSPLNNVQPQPQQPPPAPKMQDDPAIKAALQRLWDRAGR